MSGKTPKKGAEPNGVLSEKRVVEAKRLWRSHTHQRLGSAPVPRCRDLAPAEIVCALTEMLIVIHMRSAWQKFHNRSEVYGRTVGAVPHQGPAQDRGKHKWVPEGGGRIRNSILFLTGFIAMAATTSEF
jgi:hypothetical protein